MAKKNKISKSNVTNRDGRVVGKIMLIPSIFLLIVTSIYPFFWMFRYILSDYNGFQSYFTGTDNIVRMMNDKIFWQSVLHTFEYAGLKLIFILPLALIFAVFLNMKIRGGKIAQAIYFMPTVISPAVYSLIFGFIFAVFNGALNSMLSAVGIIKTPIDWLGDPKIVMYSIIIVAVWGGLGNYLILFLSGMGGISQDVYESAKIDGASGVQTFFHVTLPMLSPVLKVILLLAITSAFKDYESILVLTAGGPNNRSQVMFTYIYQLMFGTPGVPSVPQIGYGTLLSVVAALIIGIVTAVYLFFARKLDDVV